MKKNVREGYSDVDDLIFLAILDVGDNPIGHPHQHMPECDVGG